MRIIFLFLFFVSFPFLFAQPRLIIPDANISPTFIRAISISGNEKTAEYVIRRELTFTPGDTVKVSVLHYNKNRIYSLALFNKVEMFLQPVGDDSVDIRINVSERWYIYPFPVLQAIEGDFKKLNYGFSIMHSNFRGRNEKLITSFTFGYNPFLSVYYYNPLINEQPELFCESQLMYSNIRNHSTIALGTGKNFDEIHYGALFNIGRRFDLFRRFTFGGELNTVQVSAYQPRRTIAKSGKDTYVTIRTNYSYDSRDLAQYAGDGMLFRSSLAKMGLHKNGVNFTRIAFDYRRYFPLKLDSSFTATLAARLFTTATQGKNVPSYEFLYFGYQEKIRGHNQKKIEGDNVVGAAMEFRLPFFTPRIYQLAFMPVKQFSVFHFGMYLALFGNIGAMQFQPMKMNEFVFVKGYGAGIHFLLPYDFLLRTEIAFNEARQSEIILELGTAF